MTNVLLEKKGNIAVATINRPKALNALNDQVISELDQVLDTIDLDTVRCVIVTGAGEKAFVAGADIGVVNGGGIRADLPAGDITYQNLFEVHPFGNTLCMVEATGQEIVDFLIVTASDQCHACGLLLCSSWVSCVPWGCSSRICRGRSSSRP